MNKFKSAKMRLFTFLFVLLLTILSTIFAVSAYTSPAPVGTYTYGALVSRNNSNNIKNSGTNFNLENKYWVGNFIPYNDTSMESISGATANKRRRVYARITGQNTREIFEDSKASFQVLGGVSNISIKAVIRGPDGEYPARAGGYGFSYVYDGKTANDPVLKSQRLDLN